MSFHREDRIRHHETRCSEGSKSWWIERSSPQQAQKCELFLVMDFRPCSYEETYEAWKVEQEDSCCLVMAWYWRSRIFRGELEEKRQWNVNEIHLENDLYSNSNYAKQTKDNSYPLWAVGSAVSSAPMLSLLFLPLMLTLKAVNLDSKTYKLDSKRSW